MLRSPFIPPCLPTLRDRLPKGEGWLYEVKFDGYRTQVHKTGERVTLFTRNGAGWTSRLPHLAASLTTLPCSSAIIDAELIHTDGFDELNRCVNKRAENELVLWAFDLMQLNGNDLRAVALADRKRRLAHLIERAGIARLRHSESFEDGERLLAECDRRGLEGVVAKHKNGIYRSGRSTSWVKVKCSAWREANRKRGELFGEGRFPRSDLKPGAKIPPYRPGPTHKRRPGCSATNVTSSFAGTRAPRMAGMANIRDPNDHDIRPARSRPVWRKAINLPFDIIDRVFQSERASIRGVAVMIGGLALMFYLGGNLPKDYLLVEIFAVLAAVTLVASWFH